MMGVTGNDCQFDTPSHGGPYCIDRVSSSDWLFGLWPGPPQRFEPTGTHTNYHGVYANCWPNWGHSDLDVGGSGDLNVGDASRAPGGLHGACHQGTTYRGTDGEICGGKDNWGATDVEVWYRR